MPLKFNNPNELLKSETQPRLTSGEAAPEVRYVQFDPDNVPVLTAEQMAQIDEMLDSGMDAEHQTAKLTEMLKAFGIKPEDGASMAVVDFKGVDGKVVRRAMDITRGDFGTMLRNVELVEAPKEPEIVEEVETEPGSNEEVNELLRRLKSEFENTEAAYNQNTDMLRGIMPKLDVIIRALDSGVSFETGPIDQFAQEVASFPGQLQAERGQGLEAQQVIVRQLTDQAEHLNDQALQASLEDVSRELAFGENIYQDLGYTLSTLVRQLDDLATSRYGYDGFQSALIQLQQQLGPIVEQRVAYQQGIAGSIEAVTRTVS